jgi:AmmeMemoRadiSam system protein B
MLDVRPSPIAGTWYPEDPDILARSVDTMLASVEVKPPQGDIVGLVAPHAGHRYSGSVAAHAFRLVQGDRRELVAILSPMHHPYPDPVLTTAHQAFGTPLGTVEIDVDGVTQFEESLSSAGVPLVRVAHDPEHALEIELPFLQRTLSPGFRLLPIMLRDQSRTTVEAVGHALASVLADMSGLLVASSDLSHFFPAGVARRLDEELLARVRAFDPVGVLAAEEQGVGFACGKGAIAAALWAAADLGANRVDILRYAHSGDVTGDDLSVVGYGAAVIYRAAGA